MNYVLQRDKFRCGPIAILNALRWAGEDVPFREGLKQLSEQCKCAAPKGTTFRPFLKTLRSRGENLFTVEQITKPKLYDFDRHIQEGKVLVWNFKHQQPDRGRHFVLVVGADSEKKSFDVANFEAGRGPIATIERDVLKAYVKQRDRYQRV